MLPSPSSVVSAAASAGGAVLGAAFGAASAVRPTVKPLHPRGRVRSGVVVRHGLDDPTGVPWLDDRGRDDVLVRLSRSMGLPAALPDIHGLAVRVPVDDGRAADLLLATTGTGPVGRFVLLLTRSQQHPMTTLMPYRSPSGPLLLAALPRGEATYELACATPAGPWRVFGVLHCEATPAGGDDDPPVRFDPVLHTLPQLTPYEWVARLREGAYAAARRPSRGLTP